jgi:hypothetical protein
MTAAASNVRLVPAPAWDRPDYSEDEWARRTKAALREHGPTVALSVCWYWAGLPENAAAERALNARIAQLEQARLVDVLLGEAAA